MSAIRTIPALQYITVREHVVLRPLDAEDATALLAILDADPSIRERVGVTAALHSSEDVKQLLAAEEHNDTVRYVIAENTEVVGLVSFWRAGEYFGDKADPDDYGFGYFLAPSARGRGLVTDSLTALMSVAVEHLSVQRFIAFCEADNAASGALLQKAGFERTPVTWKDEEHGWIEQKYSRTPHS